MTGLVPGTPVGKYFVLAISENRQTVWLSTSMGIEKPRSVWAVRKDSLRQIARGKHPRNFALGG